MSDTSPNRSPSSGLAMVLGILVPGGGLVYTGRYLAGILTFLGVLGCLLLGILLICIPKVPLFVGLILVVTAIVVHWNTARKAYRLGASPTIRVGIPLALILFVYLPFLVSKTGLLRPFKMPTNGMGPTLQGVNSEKKFGDQLFVSRLPYLIGQPKRGDLIVFKTGKIPLIAQRSQTEQVYTKRLVGLPGEEIRIQDGSVYVNDRKLTLADGIPDIEYTNLSSTLMQRGNQFSVPDNGYFVLGDNSANSWDSRGWGSVPKESVLGRAVLIYFPFGRTGRPVFNADEVSAFKQAASEAQAAHR